MVASFLKNGLTWRTIDIGFFFGGALTGTHTHTQSKQWAQMKKLKGGKEAL